MPILLPMPRTSSVTPSLSAHSTACRNSVAARGLIVPAGIVSEPRDVGERDLVVMHHHAPQLGAAPEPGKHLPGIEQVVGIESAFHTHLLVEIDVGELLAHQVALLDADAVLPGQDPSDADAEAQDVGA